MEEEELVSCSIPIMPVRCILCKMGVMPAPVDWLGNFIGEFVYCDAYREAELANNPTQETHDG